LTFHAAHNQEEFTSIQNCSKLVDAMI